MTQGSFFDDRSAPPCGKDLARVFGPAKAFWDELIAHLAAEYPQLSHEWKFYGRKHGWQLKFLRGKKAALYLVPKDGAFLAGLALKPGAVEAVRGSNLSAPLIEEILTASTYAEGTPARVTVTNVQSLETLKSLLAICLEA